MAVTCSSVVWVFVELGTEEVRMGAEAKSDDLRRGAPASGTGPAEMLLVGIPIRIFLSSITVSPSSFPVSLGNKRNFEDSSKAFRGK